MRYGFLDWLGRRAEAARPARMPVVFQMAARAVESAFAPAPVRMQVAAGDANVVFESETDVQVVPGRLAMVVAADADTDAFYLPPPGLMDIEPTPPAPDQWLVKTFAASGSSTLQLDPAAGLVRGMTVDIAGTQYDVTESTDDLVTIDPPVVPAAGLRVGTVVRKVVAFSPFGGARNRQEHAVYLGDAGLFDLEAAATIDVVGGEQLGAIDWQYWGKTKDGDVVGWQDLPLDSRPADAVRLAKGRGAVEPTDVGGVKSRWIRAVTGSLPAGTQSVRTDSFTVRINAKNNADNVLQNPSLPLEAAPAAEQLPPVDSIVNTTVSPSTDFYPLGREPRVGDALYVGCPEAFSKSGARARIRFDLADPSFAAMAAHAAFRLVAGVDEAGALHLLKVNPQNRLERFGGHPPLRPPGAGAASGATLTSRGIRPVLWTDGGDLFVTVLGGADVYQWQEVAGDPQKSHWADQSLGSVPFDQEPTAKVTGLVGVTSGAGPSLVALRDGVLSRTVPGSAGFERIDAQINGVSVTIDAIAPIIDDSSREPTDAFIALAVKNQRGLLCRGRPAIVTGQHALALDVLGDESNDPDVDAAIVPFAALRPSGAVEVVALAAAHDRMLAWTTTGAPVTAASAPVDLPPQLEPTSFDGRVEPNSGLTAYLCAHAPAAPDAPDLLVWTPFHTDADYRAVVFREHSAPAVGIPNGDVSLLDDLLFVSGRERGQVLAASLAVPPPKPRDKFTGPPPTPTSALAVKSPAPPLGSGDVVAVTVAPGVYPDATIVSTQARTGRGPFADESFLWLDKPLPDGAAVNAYRKSQPGNVVVISHPTPMTTKFALNPGQGADGDLLLVDAAGVSQYLEATVDQNGDATVNAPLVAPVKYWAPVRAPLRLVPALDFTGNVPQWTVDRLDFGDLYFPKLDPVRQPVIAYEDDGQTAPHPVSLALETPWLNAPGVAFSFIVDGAVTDWFAALADNSSNPTLDWEYWNGTGWWLLETEDKTNNLRTSGHVMFDVPPDLKAVDWAGKTSHWVRARLAGGDYGREVVVTNAVVNGNTTTYTSERHTEGIQPPFAIAMWVRYDVTKPVVPTYLLTKDSGSIRNQSDGNRTPGARVDVFVPLATLIGRFVARGAPAPAPDDECPPECDCPGQEPPAVDPPSPDDGEDQLSVTQATGRSIFLGVAGEMSGDAVNVLATVLRETSQDRFAPLAVEALVANRLVPLVHEDKTRALGETGLLTLSLPDPPTQADLFGGRALRWVRLVPRAGAEGAWSPTLTGAYLNAVWASATETLTRELLGSSEGEPNLSVTLARPPVLRDSLVLRVKEPLGEEEAEGLDVALDTNLPGQWVLWEKVLDPSDEGPTRRVYSLDETTGEIRFGDGKHGMIPPVGRDSIVAFRYRRTEPPAPGTVDVPGNAVEARTQINLVTPVPGVEAVFSADHAAGGAPPELADRVVRFATARLRHRGRAVTLEDLEDLALESSPDVVQARALVRGRRTRLVVVVRGADPVPTEAQKRELKRLLLAAASPSFRAAGLDVVAPTSRMLRVGLRLQIAMLDDAAAVGAEVKRRLEVLLSPAVGGVTKDGWPLGASPGEDDIAYALVDVPRLEGIMRVDRIEVREGLPDGPWPDTLAPHELARLAADPVRLAFDDAEAA